MLVAGSDSSRAAIDVASIEGTRTARQLVLLAAPGRDLLGGRPGRAHREHRGGDRRAHRRAPALEGDGAARGRGGARPGARDRRLRGAQQVAGRAASRSWNSWTITHSATRWRTAYIPRVMAVTPEDVRSAVASYLDPEHMAIAIVGDREAIEPQTREVASGRCRSAGSPAPASACPPAPLRSVLRYDHVPPPAPRRRRARTAALARAERAAGQARAHFQGRWWIRPGIPSGPPMIETDDPPKAVVSDDSGYFRFAELPAGPITVRVRRDRLRRESSSSCACRPTPP